MKTVLEQLHKRDVKILKVFNQKIKCRFLDILMPVITYLGSLTFAVVLCLITLTQKNSTWRSFSIKCITTLVVSAGLVQILKINVNRIRPFLIIENLYIRKIGIDDYSFPSGHTSAAFSIATMTYYFFPQAAFISYSLSLCVGISRMYLGVHYPSDVFIGMVLGTLSSILVFNLI